MVRYVLSTRVSPTTILHPYILWYVKLYLFFRRGEGTGDGICSDAKRPYPGSFTHRALDHDTNRPNTPLTSGSGPGAPRS